MSEKLDVPVEQQRLVFKGKTLAGTVYMCVFMLTGIIFIPTWVKYVI